MKTEENIIEIKLILKINFVFLTMYVKVLKNKEIKLIVDKVGEKCKKTVTVF